MHHRAKHSPTSHVRGSIVAFNLSPHGIINGALVETSAGLVQLNFRRGEGAVLSRTMKVGQPLDLAAELLHDKGEHPVYEVGSRDAQARGTIVRLNYAQRGEVNGYFLDDGTLLHATRSGARRLQLRVGEKVTASGTRRAGADAVVFDVRDVKRVAEGTLAPSA